MKARSPSAPSRPCRSVGAGDHEGMRRHRLADARRGLARASVERPSRCRSWRSRRPAPAAASHRSGSSSRRCRVRPPRGRAPVMSSSAARTRLDRDARADIARRVARRGRRRGRRSPRACRSSCCAARSACAPAAASARLAASPSGQCVPHSRQAPSRPAFASMRAAVATCSRLARMGGAGKRDLGSSHAGALGDAALDQRQRLERLHGRAREDRPVDVAERKHGRRRPASTTETAPRWRDSTDWAAGDLDENGIVHGVAVKVGGAGSFVRADSVEVKGYLRASEPAPRRCLRRSARSPLKPGQISTGGVPDAHRDDRLGLCRPGVRAPASPISATTSCCVDKDAGKIDALQPRRDADLRAGARPTWSPTNVARGPALLHDRPRRARCATADAVFIAVGTPSRRGDGHADLSYVYQPRRARSPAALDGYTVVVTKSTVPVGTGDEVERIIREAAPGRRVRGRLQPGIPARGRGDRRLQASRPHRHRHRGRARRAR